MDCTHDRSPAMPFLEKRSIAPVMELLALGSMIYPT